MDRGEPGPHEGPGDSLAAIMTYEFKDDKIWRMRGYLNPDDALAAVGAEG